MLLVALAFGLLRCGGKDTALFTESSCSGQAAACVGAGGSAASAGGMASSTGGSSGGSVSSSGGRLNGTGGIENASGGAAAGGANGGSSPGQGGSPAHGGTGSAGQAGSAGGGSCVTSFSSGALKFGFDTMPSGGVLIYPADSTGEGVACTGPVSHSTALFTATEGHQCPGAIETTIPFGQYSGLNVLTTAINFSSADWRSYSKLHAWVKVRSPDLMVPKTNPLTYLGPLRLSVASSSAGPGTSNYSGYWSVDADIAPFSDRQWHELTLPLAASVGYYPDAVLNVGVQLSAQPTAPDGAPAQPPDTVLEIDDIWLE